MQVSDIWPLNWSLIYKMARTACVGIQSLFFPSLALLGPPWVDSLADAAVFLDLIEVLPERMVAFKAQL